MTKPDPKSTAVPRSTSDVVVEALEPLVDAGRFHAKAVVGDPLEVSADVFAHGHVLVRAWLRSRPADTRGWMTSPMTDLGNDRFGAVFVPPAIGVYELEVLGQLDELATWRRDASRRVGAGRFDPTDPAIGAALVAEAAELVPGLDPAPVLRALAEATDPATLAEALAVLGGIDEDLASRPPAPGARRRARTTVFAQREKAASSAWYECFPRSASPQAGRHGTLCDLVAHLEYVAGLGFDVLYLPPIHPIGTTARKGPGNATSGSKGDVGSPWAIGSRFGGHTAVAPELGTIEDFDHLVAEARARDLEIALDLAFQCSPDHPWVSEHPSFFAHRPDGTIACAENPPKRYEDVYPLDFDTRDRDSLWRELLGVVCFWIDHGVRIFRVDNPHTKPFAFFEWLITSVRREHPEVIFLSEAFTRPKVMHRLAKLGFDQSYTYFTWRDTKGELVSYFEELAHGPGRAYLRPNVWPNTPDILAKSLQHGGRASFVSRLVLAAGLSANYGIYGPVFELLVDRPTAPGSEEYERSEKYELRHFDLDDPNGIAGVVAAVNAARREHPALRRNASLRFHRIDNEQLVCWSKHDVATGDTVLCVVSLDPDAVQSGFVELDLGAIGLGSGASYVVNDLLDGAVYSWRGRRNFVLLDPARASAHLFAVEPAIEGVDLELLDGSPVPAATSKPA